MACTPLAFQWHFENTVLAAQTNSTLMLSNLQSSAGGNYLVVVTASGGSATSAVATLTMVLPPTITVPPLAQTVQCGSNAAFNVTATGTPPLNYQWSLDSVPIAGATNTGLSLTNVHLPTHAVAVVVASAYGGVTSSVPLIVQDTLPPLLTLNGSTPAYVELGSAFLDPGATAYDLCAGAVPLVATGTVNTNAVSTNTVTYTATDGNGNTNSATRTVVVRDTTPPTIVWSFTNLVLAAGTNCTAAMPEVTGTNYLLATDLSGTLTVTQVPTNSAALPLGTNVVIITVADASGNASYSTNEIIVQDQTPPVLTLNGSTPAYVELGSAFLDPGATAYDLCSGTVPVVVNGTVNTNAVSTNTVTYTATDGNGNTNTATRTVIVRDTTPPTIVWSFTNLVLAAGTHCTAAMPDVTGTNYLLATDLSGTLTVTQVPTNSAALPLGTNVVIITVADASGNASYSTNEIIVQDQTPPVLTLNGSTPAYVELGSAFLDPGATAYDLCSGTVPVVATGTVNTDAVSTNTVTYTATDGNGNTNTAIRTVVVRDTTPPTIVWSFTNLVLAAGTHCTAAMPEVTGTNYLLATDLSGTLTVTQVPTNNAALPLGTNVVIITVADASGNAPTDERDHRPGPNATGPHA